MARTTPAVPVDDAYFIPERVAASLLPFPKGLQAKRTTIQAASSGFRRFTPSVKGYLLKGPLSRLVKFQVGRGLQVVEPMALLNKETVKESICPILNFAMSKDSVTVELQELPSLVDLPEVPLQASMVLAHLALATGFRFKLVFSNHRTKPPGPREPGLVHVYVGPVPPGPVQETRVTRLFDVQLVPYGDLALRYTSPNVAGQKLCDTNDEVYAHVWGSTFWLNLPIQRKSQLRLMAAEDLFVKAFVPAWNAFVAQKRERAPALKVGDYPVFEAHVRKRMGEVREQWQEDLKAQDENIERLMQELTSAHGNRMMFASALDGFERVTGEQLATLKDDWEEIRRQPLVQALRIEGDGLHVETKDVHIEHEGKRYRIGKFTIRYPFNGHVSTWAHEPAHPKGVMHPHISPEGAVCYGNVTTALARAAGHGRTAEAVDLVLRWLTDGYDPVGAQTKVEEWPLAKEVKHEPCASNQAL